MSFNPGQQAGANAARAAANAQRAMGTAQRAQAQAQQQASLQFNHRMMDDAARRRATGVRPSRNPFVIAFKTVVTIVILGIAGAIGYFIITTAIQQLSG